MFNWKDAIIALSLAGLFLCVICVVTFFTDEAITKHRKEKNTPTVKIEAQTPHTVENVFKLNAPSDGSGEVYVYYIKNEESKERYVISVSDSGNVTVNRIR